MQVPLIYKERPLFGLDIGHNSAKLVQLRRSGKELQVVGYGAVEFPADSIVEGIIADPQAIADKIRPLLAKLPAGKLTANRVATSLPVARVFTRQLQLPMMSAADLAQAVHYEAEQYVPVPISDLYIDYEIVETVTDEATKQQHLDVLMVAAPRAIVDSYLKLFELLKLEPGVIEMSLSAIARAMISANRAGQTSLVMDFGSQSTDITIYDAVLRLTGTIGIGGEMLTQTIIKTLGITAEQADEIKKKFGIGPSDLQHKIMEAIEPQLKQIVAEVKKVMKYYHERSEKKHEIQTLVLSGGSASMPGLVDYLYAQLGKPIIIGNSWAYLNLGRLPEVEKTQAPMYTTAIGLALLETKQ